MDEFEAGALAQRLLCWRPVFESREEKLKRYGWYPWEDRWCAAKPNHFARTLVAQHGQEMKVNVYWTGEQWFWKFPDESKG